MQTYTEKVLGVTSVSWRALWPLTETSGTTVSDVSGNGRNGTYARNVTTMTTGDGIATGETAPLFDGANDVADVYSAGLSAAFDVPFSIIAWGKVASPAWTDGIVRNLWRFDVDAQNRVHLQKNSTSNQIYATYEANDIQKNPNAAGLSTTDWMFWLVTVDQTADELKLYYRLSGGSLTLASTTTGLGVWSGGALSSTATVIGNADNTPAAGFGSWKGYLNYVGIADGVLSADDRELISTV